MAEYGNDGSLYGYLILTNYESVFGGRTRRCEPRLIVPGTKAPQQDNM